MKRLLLAAVCPAVLSLAAIASSPRADPMLEQSAPAPAFRADCCRDPGPLGELGTPRRVNQVGVAAAGESEADVPAADTLFEMLRPEDASPGGEEFNCDAMVSPGHQLDFETIVFNWSMYLEPLGSNRTLSAIGPELPLTAYAVGYTRPKKGMLAETRYGFTLGRMLEGLGLVVLCAGLVLSGFVAVAAFLRRRG